MILYNKKQKWPRYHNAATIQQKLIKNNAIYLENSSSLYLGNGHISSSTSSSR